MSQEKFKRLRHDLRRDIASKVGQLRTAAVVCFAILFIFLITYKYFRNDGVYIDPTVYGSSKQMIQLSWTPRIMLYPNFLTLEECTGVIELTKLKNDFLPGKGKNEKEVWFSDRTAFVNNVPPLIQTITERIATVTHIPTTHAEGLNVVRYNITEGYGFNPHHDYIYGDEWKEHIEKYGNRIATMIIYLNDVEGGGETVFPRINLSIRPKAGTALLFYSLTPDLQLDELTEHASLRVTKGEKWIATRWIRQHVYA